jgi:hypothetical protein
VYHPAIASSQAAILQEPQLQEEQQLLLPLLVLGLSHAQACNSLHQTQGCKLLRHVVHTSSRLHQQGVALALQHKPPNQQDGWQATCRPMAAGLQQEQQAVTFSSRRTTCWATCWASP